VGPAGENLVSISTIVFDRFRGAGRGGLGAVMGSKNLNALVVRGSGGIRAAHPARLKENVLRFIHTLEKEPYYKRYSKEGTAVIAESMKKLTGCPRKGEAYQQEGFHKANVTQIHVHPDTP